MIINVISSDFANLSFSSTKSSPAFEKVLSPCGELVYFFGYEPLRMSEGKGVLVSYWGFDPRVKSLQVNYHFARTCLETFGIGFGGRASVPSKGLNLYLKVSTWGIISFPFFWKTLTSMVYWTDSWPGD